LPQGAKVGIDEADRVVDLVCDARGQLADRGHFFRLQQLVVSVFQALDQNLLFGLFLLQLFLGAFLFFQLFLQGRVRVAIRRFRRSSSICLVDRARICRWRRSAGACRPAW
jgi:hypothetical protein